MYLAGEVKRSKHFMMLVTVSAAAGRAFSMEALILCVEEFISLDEGSYVRFSQCQELAKSIPQHTHAQPLSNTPRFHVKIYEIYIYFYLTSPVN